MEFRVWFPFFINLQQQHPSSNDRPVFSISHTSRDHPAPYECKINILNRLTVINRYFSATVTIPAVLLRDICSRHRMDRIVAFRESHEAVPPVVIGFDPRIDTLPRRAAWRPLLTVLRSAIFFV